MNTEPYCFIVNPKAGGASALGKWQAFAAVLRREQIRFQCVMSESRGHATALASSAVKNGSPYIVAVGGDGTLNEVLNGVLRAVNGGPRPVLGFMAAGSSNDFVRSFGGGNGSFLRRLIAGASAPMEVGTIECRDEDGRPGLRYFLVNASVGILPRALEFFNMPSPFVRALKRLSVDGAVVWSALNAIARHASQEYGLTIDGRRRGPSVLTNLAILRGANFGGGMSYGLQRETPGSFSVVGIEDMSKPALLTTILRFYRGTILSHPRVWHESASEILIESGKAGRIEADGELVGYLPARFSIADGPMEMIY